MSSGGLHNQYRPTSLDGAIGNEKAVLQLKGILKSGKFPSAILFTGPPGCGKTTLARAFVNDVLQEHTAENLTEVNFGSDRGIDEIRQLISLSRLRPTPGASRRFVLGDEVHQLVSNKPAADAFLKPLEEPVKTTTFLLCSMDPEKFSSTTTGRAIASRCLRISLTKASSDEVKKQALRILKGEGIRKFVSAEALAAIVENADGSLREVANGVELLSSYLSGQATPKELTAEDIGKVLLTGDSSDDVIAARFLMAVYDRKYVAAHRELLEVADPLGFVGKCVWMNWFVQNQIILKGARHPKVWGNTAAWGLWKQLSPILEPIPRDQQITLLGEVQAALTSLKFGLGVFAVDERIALASMSWTLVSKLKTLIKIVKE